MIRFYLLPIERFGMYSGPKYFTWRYDPDPPGIDALWSLKSYGVLDMGLLCGDVMPEQNGWLVTNYDIFGFPPGLDDRLFPVEQKRLLRICKKGLIPTTWLEGELTIKIILRTLAAIFDYTEKLCRQGGDPRAWPANLNTEWHELSSRQKDWIKQAAYACGYCKEFIKVHTTLEEILIGMANQWGKKIVRFKYMDL